MCGSSASNAYGSGGTSYAMAGTLPLFVGCDRVCETSLASFGGLVPNRSRAPFVLLGVAQVRARPRREVEVELVDPRHASRNVEVDHLLIAQPLQVLHTPPHPAASAH